MIEPRTVKVLLALVAAMTVGSLLLGVVERDPPRFSRNDAATVRSAVVNSQWQPTATWRRVVVHSANSAKADLPGRCHFIIHAAPDDAGIWIEPTDLWKNQQPGQHAYLTGNDFNIDSIGVCLIGDFSQRPPVPEQYQALVALVRELQGVCEISSDRVFLYSQMNTHQASPGPGFPEADFQTRLLP